MKNMLAVKVEMDNISHKLKKTGLIWVQLFKANDIVS